MCWKAPHARRRVGWLGAVALVAGLLVVPGVTSAAAASPSLDQPLVLTPGVTQAGAEPATWSLDLRTITRDQAQAAAGGLSSRIYGGNGAYPTDLRKPLMLRTDYGNDVVLGFYVSAVCFCGADLQVKIDGTLFHTLVWKPASSTYHPDTLYYFTVPAGDHIVSFGEAACDGPVVIQDYTYANSVDDLPGDRNKEPLEQATTTTAHAEADARAPADHSASARASAGSTAAAGRVQMSVDQGTPESHYYRDTTGISIGKQNLSRPSVMRSPYLAQYLRTLSPSGVLRIGAIQVEQTVWTSPDEPVPPDAACWAEWTVTPENVEALATLLHRTRWRVVYGVNLRHFDPERAADEIAHVSRMLGPSLAAVQIGNESNGYYRDDTDRFWADFETYVNAIHAAAPNVKIMGPTKAGGPDAWLTAFVDHEKALDHPDISALNTHRYSFGGCSGDLARLLSDGNWQAEVAYADTLVADAGLLHVPALISETNSASGGGCAGVSDTMGAALWTLDYTLTVAEHGVRGTYYHTSLGKCGDPRPDFTDYSSFCALTDEDAMAAKEQIRPPFYGLLALGQVSPGTFLKVSNPDQATIRVHAIRNGDHLDLVLINVADPATTGATNVSVDLGRSYDSALSTTLATSSPDGLAAKSGITLGDGTVGSDGVFAGAHPTPVPVHGKQLQVSLAAGTAQIISLY